MIVVDIMEMVFFVVDVFLAFEHVGCGVVVKRGIVSVLSLVVLFVFDDFLFDVHLII
jgi:hypothetical protein